MATIDILLATYNGARYLPELLESLERQTFKDWRLIVRDDGSTDESISIIDAWSKRQGRRTRILQDGQANLGPSANFGVLLRASDSPYFTFCDQDDVWLSTKLDKLLKRTRSAEERLGDQTPILVHSDLTVADHAARPIHASFRRYMGRPPPRPDRALRHLLIQNFAVGCASMGNAALRGTAQPIPPEAMMHDWWLALVAAAFGEVVELPESTVLYRQHGGNAAGARSWDLSVVMARLWRDPRNGLVGAKSMIAKSQRQALALAERYTTQLDPPTLALLDGYAHLGHAPACKRKLFIVSNGVWSRNWIKNLSFIVLI